jgi:excisionase family DNA binding protein
MSVTVSMNIVHQIWRIWMAVVTKRRTNGWKAESTRNPDEAPDEIMTVHALSAFLHCHASTIYRMVKEGRIPHFRLGSDLRFRKESIRAWIISHSHSGI